MFGFSYIYFFNYLYLLCFSELAGSVNQGLEEIVHEDSGSLSVAGGILIGFGGLAVACVCGVCLRCLQQALKKKSNPKLSSTNSSNLIDFENFEKNNNNNNNNKDKDTGLEESVVEDQKSHQFEEFDPLNDSKVLDQGQANDENELQEDLKTCPSPSYVRRLQLLVDDDGNEVYYCQFKS